MGEKQHRAEGEAAALSQRIREGARRVLVLGGAELGTERLLSQVAETLAGRGLDARVVSANLGSPLFGPPGAVTMGRWEERGGFRIERVEALCTLDVARFRLPLVLAARRLLEQNGARVVLVAAPSVVRGVAASELRSALTDLLELDYVLEPSEDAAEAWRTSAADRRRRRTELWDRYLSDAEEVALSLSGRALVGAAPPPDVPDAWPGRQVGLLDDQGRTVTLGEARRLSDGELVLAAPAFDAGDVRSVCARDARRVEGVLVTEHRPRTEASDSTASDLHARPRGDVTLVPPVVSIASTKALLVNGIFGDPLLHLRLRHRKRSLLFDLGEAARLQGRIVHQVSDVFVTHAHFDHFGGFSWLLRACIGSPGLRRLWGPPGLARHVEGAIAGVLWDRIGERGPRFDVGEVHGDEIRRFHIRVGGGAAEHLPSAPLRDGVLLDEPELRVRTTVLDHGVPVLAFAFEEPRALHVRRDTLAASGLAPGPWLSRLKELALAGVGEETLELPNGTRGRVAELESELLLARPGQKLVYATDLDDTQANRDALTELARGAYVLYCEASFTEEDRALARASQHLTARACGEIAAAAGVERLVPFHFSKRYDGDPARVYAQVSAVFESVVMARPLVRRRA